jgi:hypothetical protein
LNGHPRDYWLEARVSGNDETRWEAIDAIRHICPPHDALPLYLSTLGHDAYWRSRALAAHAIYDLAWDAEYRELVHTTIPSLIDALLDTSRQVREQVIITLELLRGAAAPAVLALDSIANGDDAELADLARNAIEAITS